jgi:hypothetical protein
LADAPAEARPIIAKLLDGRGHAPAVAPAMAPDRATLAGMVQCGGVPVAMASPPGIPTPWTISGPLP